MSSDSRRHSIGSSSSLEIIDEDELQGQEDYPAKDQQGAELVDIVEGLEKSVKGITVSQFTPEQVVFLDVSDTYSQDIVIRFESKGDELLSNDAVAIFRTPFLDIKDCIAAAKVIIDENQVTGEARFSLLQQQLTANEFYQFQYLRYNTASKSTDDVAHKICGASVPWQFTLLNNQQLTNQKEASVWNMEKFNQIEGQIWSDNTSKLAELCLAEQIKEFISPLEVEIQRRFLSTLLNPWKLDVKLHKSCAVFSKMGRIFGLLSNMKVGNDCAMTFGELIEQTVASVRVDVVGLGDNVFNLVCSNTMKVGCTCPIYDFVLRPKDAFSPLEISAETLVTTGAASNCTNSTTSLQQQENILAGWNNAALMHNNKTAEENAGSISCDENAVNSDDSEKREIQQKKLLKGQHQNLADLVPNDFYGVVNDKAELISIGVKELNARVQKLGLGEVEMYNLKAARRLLKNRGYSKRHASYCQQKGEEWERRFLQENEELKRQLDSADSSILVLDQEKTVLAESLDLVKADKERLAKELGHFETLIKKQSIKIGEGELENEKLKGELNIVKKRLEECIQNKAELYTKLDAELTQREHLIAKIQGLESTVKELGEEKADLLRSKEKLKIELIHVNQMLEAAQMSKEAVARNHEESTQQSSDSLSWVNCSNNSIPDGVDKDLVAVLSNLGTQLEAARDRIKELEQELKVARGELVSKASAKEALNSPSGIDVEKRIVSLEKQNERAMQLLEARTQKLESVQADLKKFMDSNMEQMSQRLSLVMEESKACGLKIQRLEMNSGDGGSSYWSDRETISGSVLSSRASIASSCNSNMNSIKIAAQLSTSGREEPGAVLPDPLVPEKLAAHQDTTEDPVPGAAKPGGSESGSAVDPDWVNQEDGSCMFCQQYCNKLEQSQHVCGKETEMSKAHRKQKELLKAQVPFCPICFQTFEAGDERKLQEHVNAHFQNSSAPQDDFSFLDLGID